MLHDRQLNPEYYHARGARCLPSGSRLVEVQPMGKLVAEPAKNATSCGLRLIFDAKGEGAQSSLDVFVKFQCGCGLLLWVQAIREALDPGVSREVLFYQRLAHRVPMRVAQPYYAAAAHWCNRVCIVLEHLGEDAVVIPDWKGARCPFERSSIHLSAVWLMPVVGGAYRWH